MEFAIHAITETYEGECTEGVLLVDTSGAFNTHSIIKLTLPTPKSTRNTIINIYKYQENADLFVGGETSESREGTIQADA